MTVQGEAGSVQKRRDNLADALTAPVYTDAPTLPYLFIVENLIYSCYRFAPGAAAALLSPGVAADANCTAIICIYRHGPGWGLAHACGGFLSVVVDGFDAPDTGQGAFIVGGFNTEPAATLQARHYAASQPGRSEIRVAGCRVTGNLWSDRGHVCEMVVDLHDAPPTENSTGDRYLGLNAAGEVTSSLWSVTGPALGAKFTALTLGEAAPAEWRALASVKLEWGSMCHSMLVSLSVPTPILGSHSTAVALLRGLDGLDRAACIVTRTGKILQINDTAMAFLKDSRLASLGQMTLPDPKEQARLTATLNAMATGRQPGAPGPFLLPRDNGRGPLIAQLAPLDAQIVADACLVLITDPEATRTPPRAELLQLLNLTPSEARVAALVGSGLPPREAALSLGLTEGRVRSTLKLVFSKLCVNRQAELVRLLGRLGSG